MRKFLAVLVAAFFMPLALAQTVLLNGATSTGAGSYVAGNNAPSGYKTYQCYGTTTASTGSAVITIEGSNNQVASDVIGTITLTLGTTYAPASSGSFTSADRYTYVRANVGTLTGTGAAASCNFQR